VREQYGKLSGGVGIVTNLLLCLMKIIVGLLFKSIAIVADGVNNLSDAGNAVITLVGFRLAAKPADKDHPFGHARYEYISGLAVAVMILLIGLELLKSSVTRIIYPASVQLSVVSGLVLTISIFAKLWIYFYFRRNGKRIGSTTLMASAADSRNDVIMTSAVLTAAVVETSTGLPIDGYMGSAVAVFVICSGFRLAKDGVSLLIGEGITPELEREIIDFINSFDAVMNAHDLLVHDYGPGQRYATIHVEVDKEENPLHWHGLLDEIERACVEKYRIQLVIHAEPVVCRKEECCLTQSDDGFII
jgi:cation diffusion facilitator family transporter